MKSAVPAVSEEIKPAGACPAACAAEPCAEISLFADLSELCKARLTALVLFTTAAGYALACPAFDPAAFGVVLGGTALVAASAAVLNQWIEREIDGRMRRTAARPLPAGRLPASAALALGLAAAAAGLSWLIVFSTPLAAATAAATLLIYLFIYTPLKQRSAACTLAGAVSGALPPVIGAAAAPGAPPAAVWFLFGVLFLWQIPHFHAIAWLYREDYEAAGLVMIPRTDRDGRFTAGTALAAAAGLVLLPPAAAATGLNAPWLAWGGALLGAGFCRAALSFLRERSRLRARALFFASIIYLPLILLAAVALRAW